MIRTRQLATLAVAALAFSLATRVATATPKDTLVEKPQLDLPQRGSIAGSLSHFAIGPSDLARGLYSLPLPIATPQDRGPLLAGVAPTYSGEGGISEWGMGWQTSLSIRRHRIAGEIDFTTGDGFVSPWGRLAEGDDGAYYPVGLAVTIRVSFDGASWTALAPDGTRYRFDAVDAVTTPLGTYEWMLSRVETLLGDSTTLVWTKNASGRAFASEVRWGGRGDGTQYRMRFEYESLATPFESFVSGQRLALDRRVKRVVMETVSAGLYAERWHYDLAYAVSPTGPAFYLLSLRRTFRSGEAEPVMTYDYDYGAEQLATAVFQQSTKITTLLAQYGETAAEPDRAGMTDLEQNGLTDLEVHGTSATEPDQTRVTQTEAGFLFEQVPHVAGESALCRPAPTVGSRPRHLARMDGRSTDPHVVVTVDDSITDQTRIVICDYYGRAFFDHLQPGAWHLDANTRLVDIDLDHQPDIVRVRNGVVRVLKNVTLFDPVSGLPYFAFTPLAGQPLTVGDGVTTVTPLASWVLDFNGDGRADIMVRHAGGVVVWRGIGSSRFESIGTSYPFQLLGDGGTLNPIGYEFSHGDFNNDGLADVILSNGTQLLLFTNRGTSFVQVAVPGLGSIGATGGYPVVADLSGTGNEQVILPQAGTGYALQLTTASTGLLRSTDDGKGTVVHFGYGRVAPVSGMRHRYAIVSALTTESSGYDAVTHGYQYGTPVWHTLGKYLVGFSAVTKISPFLVQTVGFHNDDNVSGVVVSEQDVDGRTAGVVRFRERTLTPAAYHGVPWMRLDAETNGWRNGDGSSEASTRTDYLAYERGLCPVIVEAHTPHGVLRQETTLATADLLDPELSCLTGSARELGTHPDPALDFDYRIDIERDTLGRLTRAWQVGPAGKRLVQHVTYNAMGRIGGVSAPAEGKWSYTYDATTGQIATITSPEGVVQTVLAREPFTDAMTRWRLNRGGSTATTSYAFDDQERLARTWDSVSGTTAVKPSSELAYTYATSTTPAHILEKRLVDLATGATAERAELFAADGATITTASRQANGWAFGSLARSERTSLTERRYVRDPLTSIEGLTHTALAANATLVGESTMTGAGALLASSQTVQTGVVSAQAITRAIVGGELVTTVVENGTHTTRTGAGGDGVPRWFADQLGVVTEYEYDALGRVRRVHTPSGDQRLDFDPYGKPSVAEREGIARIEWSYDATSGHLLERRDLDGTGALDRRTLYARDVLGRVDTVIELKLATGAIRVVKQAWDGKNFAGEVVYPGQRGFETMTTTAPLTKITSHRPDGKTTSNRWTFDNWRAIEQAFEYLAGGQIKHVTTRIDDLDPATPAVGTVRTIETDYTYDAQGRIATCRVDGVDVYQASYDARGRLAELELPDGGTLTFAFDATTRADKGWTIAGGAPSGSLTWRKNVRGLVASETFGVGDDLRRRSYGYDSRGYLKSTTDQVKAPSATTWTPAGTASYDYDDSGLIAFASDPLGGGAIARSATSITVGGEHYEVDTRGRIVSRGDLQVEYGPSGMLETATRAGNTFTYVYDERGARVMKLANGAPVAGYINQAYVTADRFIEPVEVGGVLIGVLDNGQLTRLPFDGRGSRIGAGGALDVATAYGGRAASGDPVVAAAIDYARSGYDADLGLVRMGVRDYDPRLGQFWTPDPVFLTSIEKCVASPAECNLYGYAKNDPVSFVDVTGTEGQLYQGRPSLAANACTETNPSGSWVVLPDLGGGWKNRGEHRNITLFRELEMSLRRVADASSGEMQDGQLAITLPHRGAFGPKRADHSRVSSGSGGDANVLEKVAGDALQGQADPIDRGVASLVDDTTRTYEPWELTASEKATAVVGLALGVAQLLHADMKDREWARMSPDQQAEKKYNAILGEFVKTRTPIYGDCACGTPADRALFLRDQFRKVHEHDALDFVPDDPWQKVKAAR